MADPVPAPVPYRSAKAIKAAVPATAKLATGKVHPMLKRYTVKKKLS